MLARISYEELKRGEGTILGRRVAADGALADAAATLAANSVRKVDDVDAALWKLMEISGVIGVLVVKADRFGVAGDLPPLVKCADPLFPEKTFHA